MLMSAKSFYSFGCRRCKIFLDLWHFWLWPRKITNDNFMQMIKDGKNFMFLAFTFLVTIVACLSFFFINFNENCMQTIFRKIAFLSLIFEELFFDFEAFFQQINLCLLLLSTFIFVARKTLQFSFGCEEKSLNFHLTTSKNVKKKLCQIVCFRLSSRSFSDFQRQSRQEN